MNANAHNRSHTALPPILIAAVVLVVVVLGWFGFGWFQAQKAAAAERAALLARVEAELQRPVAGSGELSQLMASIRKLAEHETAPDLLAAQARIELLRGRPERAAELFLPIARRPGAAPADQGLGAEILLQQAAGGVADRSTAVGMLEDALAFATTAHAASQDPGDLLRAWLAAMRLSDRDRSQQLADRIEGEHAGTPAAALVALARAFSPTTSQRELDEVRQGFPAVAPPELDAMAALIALQTSNLNESLRLVEPLLARAGGVVEVRWAAAVVFHAFGLGSPTEGPDRAQWMQRRDAQLDWLVNHAAPTDERRATWAQMRSQR